jgi:LmbE family N-acetylglucosaminyl deacetylase
MTRTVVVSTHLDDAVFSCYGAIGPDVTVLTVLAGIPPAQTVGAWDARGGVRDSREHVEERREEDIRAIERSGAQVIHLDFPDAQYARSGAVKAPSLDSVVRALGQHLRGASTVYAPSALSARTLGLLRRLRRRRSDHRLIRDAVLSVRPDAVLYADLPYARHPAGGFDLPAELVEQERRQYVTRLEGALLEEKLEASACYASQLPQLRRIFGDFLDDAMLGTEVYWTPVAGGGARVLPLRAGADEAPDALGVAVEGVALQNGRAPGGAEAGRLGGMVDEMRDRLAQRAGIVRRDVDPVDAVADDVDLAAVARDDDGLPHRHRLRDGGHPGVEVDLFERDDDEERFGVEVP